jgi:Protein of unknown function (DUF3501)
MRPLTIDDLMPLEEYVGRRREFFESHRRYLDTYRRVRIGPRLTLLFENRQTLWFRVQEIVRVTRLTDPSRLRAELDVYNELLPAREQLQAALVIDVADETRLVAELAAWSNIAGDNLRLHLGANSYPAALVTCRPEDRSVGTAHWVQFHIDAAGRELLADFAVPSHFSFDNGAYRHQSSGLSAELRQSLLDDLELSERDG